MFKYFELTNLKINGNLAKLIEHSDSKPECLDEFDEGFSRSLRILYGKLFKNVNNENCQYLSLIEHCEAVIKVSLGLNFLQVTEI